jgi:hypothetical protein
LLAIISSIFISLEPVERQASPQARTGAVKQRPHVGRCDIKLIAKLGGFHALGFAKRPLFCAAIGGLR